MNVMSARYDEILNCINQLYSLSLSFPFPLSRVCVYLCALLFETFAYFIRPT